MPTLHRSLALMVLAAYLLVGGQAGLCALWHGLDVEHHHHAGEHAHDSSSTCSKAVADCEQPAQPCRESAEHDGDQLTALLPDSPPSITSPSSGKMPLPEPDFSAAKAPTSTHLLAGLRDTARGSPPSARPALLCRFLV